MPQPTTNWRTAAFSIVAAVTVFREVALYFSNADLFVDESQYWLWGQNLDFGYYSKPPLIAWVIRLVTDLSGSSSAFWIRIPAPIFHGITALVLFAWAKRDFGLPSANWVAASYVTLPIVTVGSAVISTDTIMAPFSAFGLLFHSKLLDSGRQRYAVLTGLMVGLAIMAKYAGVYFLLCAALAAVFLPSYRISVRNTVALIAGAVLVVSPNIFWNLKNDLTTLEHTLDNVDWVRPGAIDLNFNGLAEFFLSQFLVMGPVLFTALLYLYWKAPTKLRSLIFLSLPIIALVSLQALMSGAYANWEFAAYFAAVLAVVPWLYMRRKLWLWISLAFNGTIALLLPIMAVFAAQISLNGTDPLMIRYLGRKNLSLQIYDLAENYDPDSIVASNRDVLADLFVTGRFLDIPVYSVAAVGRPKNYYQQNFPFVSDGKSTVLFITSRKDMICEETPVPILATLETAGTAYVRRRINAYLLGPDCHVLIR